MLIYYSAYPSKNIASAKISAALNSWLHYLYSDLSKLGQISLKQMFYTT